MASSSTPDRSFAARLREALAIVSMSLGLLWLPVRWTVVQVDSPLDTMWGAPLPWRSPSIIFSMATDVYLAPLVINALVCLAVAWIIHRAWRARSSHVAPAVRWIAAGASGVCMARHRF